MLYTSIIFLTAGSQKILAAMYAVGLMGVYSPWLTGVFLATVPIYVGMMWFSIKVLRPLFADIEESQGKYASHQVDAIKGIETVKAASGELAFRDAMLKEFLGVSRKMFRANFILMSADSVLHTIGLVSTALPVDGVTRVMQRS
jgi:ATP-binding cassette subfamily B protein